MAVLEEVAGRTGGRARMTARQRVVLGLLLGAQFMLAVDFSILNVALPAVGDGLGFGLHALQWVASGFALPAAGLTLLSGRIADLFGRRRMFLIGMALLAAGSLVGGLAVSPAMLLTGRVLQGVATAIATPAALSLLTTSFPEGPLRSRALGLNGALMSAGFTAGAVLGGVLTDLLSWRWAFLVNVPIAVFILAVTPRLVAGGRAAGGTRLDIPGAVTVTGGLLALVYGVTAAGEWGWTAPVTLVFLAAAGALLVAFWFAESRAAAPLVPVRILRRRTVVWGNVAGLIAFLTETSLVFLMTLYLQGVLRYSPLVTGLAFGVLGAGTVTGGLLGARLIARLGTYRVLVGAFVLQAAATASLVALGDAHDWIALFLVASFVGGVGNMQAIVAFMVTATSALPDGEQGLATGLATMTQQIGITVGIPIMSAIVAARTSALGGPHATAILGGVRLAVLVNAAIVLAGALLTGLFLRRRTAS